MEEGQVFTAGEVVRITGVSYGTLKFWAKIGVVRPFTAPSGSARAGKRGKRRLYDFNDLVAVRLALRLRHSGVLGRSLRKVVNQLRARGFDGRFAEVALEISGDDVVMHDQANVRTSVLCQPGQLLLWFTADVSGTVTELQQIAARVCAPRLLLGQGASPAVLAADSPENLATEDSQRTQPRQAGPKSSAVADTQKYARRQSERRLKAK